jgi:plasmid stabilization system protein ParE
MNDHAFHPEADRDIDAIWEFIATDDLEAADKVIEDILARIESLAHFRTKDTGAPT